MLEGNTDLTEQIIGCAIEVHRELGPGLPESVCEAALCMEMQLRGISFRRQCGIPIFYKGQLISERRPDLIVADEIVIEVKSIERIAPVHVAQVLTYLRITWVYLRASAPPRSVGTCSQCRVLPGDRR